MCYFAETPVSKKNITAGIVLGSISLAFICIFGILFALYCFVRPKRLPPDDSSHQADYSHVDDETPPCDKDSEIEHELENETAFNGDTEYQPPIITPLINSNINDSDN